MLTISGKAFLWHQVRCIVAILFRIGAGKERPDVIQKLLDVNMNPCRPQYTMASEVPLNLFHVEFDADKDLTWNYDLEALTLLTRQFQVLWTEHSVKASMLRTALKDLETLRPINQNSDKSDEHIPNFQADSLVSGNYKRKDYLPLMEMQTCPALEQKLCSSSAKRRKNPV